MLLTPIKYHSFFHLNLNKFCKQPLLIKSITSNYKSNNIINKNIKLFMRKSGFNNEVIYTPKTYNQKQYVEYLNNKKNDLIVVIGPAGSGKTMFACLKAIESLRKNDVNKIILTRPVVTVEEDIGFLPGNIVKKMDPWTRPIFDIFLEYYSQSEVTKMVNDGVIEISPLAFMRGRTFKNAFIIADEMQNSSPNQMMMLTTRVGTSSRMVITGDLEQSDKFIDNGLKDFISKYNYYTKNNEEKDDNSLNEIKLIKLNDSDILRSVLVEKVLKMYNFKKDFTTSTNTVTPVKNNAFLNNTTKITERISKVDPSNDAAMIPWKQLHPGF
jgi:phosphate starvation-inducible PhoH-like protein